MGIWKKKKRIKSEELRKKWEKSGKKNKILRRK